MKASVALALFFIGSFVLIAALLRIPLIEYGIPGIFIVLFIAAIIAAAWNAARQGAKLDAAQKAIKTEAPAREQATE